MKRQSRIPKLVGGGFLYCLSALSLVSVGFASFLFDSGTTITDGSANFNVGVGDVKVLLELDTSYNGKGFSVFSFCGEGFVKDGKIVPTGLLTFYFVVSNDCDFSNSVFEADLLLNGSTIFNDSSYTLDDVSLTFSSQELEVSSAEVSNVDLDGIQGSEVIRSIFTVEGIPASENSTKAQLTYAFNSKFLHLGNGFDEDNKPSFSIRVRVIN